MFQSVVDTVTTRYTVKKDRRKFSKKNRNQNRETDSILTDVYQNTDRTKPKRLPVPRRSNKIHTI